MRRVHTASAYHLWSRRETTRRLAVIAAVLSIGFGLTLVPPLATSGEAAASGSATWVLDGGPASLGEQGSTSVSCPTLTYCMELPPNQYDLNSYIWSGGVWSTSSLVSTGGALQLNSVSCVSPTFCMAGGMTTTHVGGSHQETVSAVTETWNGTSWSLLANPEATASNAEFRGVSCASTSFCVAVGEGGVGDFIDQWDGSSWTESTDQGRLTSISCPSTTSCVAVGEIGNGLDSYVLADGTWTDVPVTSPGDQNSLSSVSCVTASFCVAVGDMIFDTTPYAMSTIEIWDGSSWTISPSPNSAVNLGSLPGSGVDLLGVACTSTSACVAVGSAFPIGGTDANGLSYPGEAIVETWDGNDWSITPTPAPMLADGQPGVQLDAVTCVPTMSNAQCVTVGSEATQSTSSTIVMESYAAIGSLVATVTQVDTSISSQITASVSSPGSSSSSRLRHSLSTTVDQPTGSVTFLNDGDPIPACPPTDLDTSDEVVCVASGLSGPISAIYSGDATFDGSTNGAGAIGPPPTTTTSTTTTSTLPPTTTTSTTTTSTTTTSTTTSTLPPTTTTSTLPPTTTTSTLPPTTTTSTTTTSTTTTSTLPPTTTTSTLPPTTTTSTTTTSTLPPTTWLKPRLVAVGRFGEITTTVITHNSGELTFRATYEVSKPTHGVKGSISRTVSRSFGTKRLTVRSGSTQVVLKPTASALAALKLHGSYMVVIQVIFSVGSKTSTRTLRVTDRYRK